MIFKDLKKFIGNLRNKPLNEDYLKALRDVEDEIERLESKYRDAGDMSIKIDRIAETGYCAHSGTIQDGIQFLADYVLMSVFSSKERNRFLVEITSIHEN